MKSARLSRSMSPLLVLLLPMMGATAAPSAYVNSGSLLGRLNLTTGQITTIGAFGTDSGSGNPINMYDIALLPSGELFGTGSGGSFGLFSIDRETGAATWIGSTEYSSIKGLGVGTHANTNGVLYTGGNGRLFKVSTYDGSISTIGYFTATDADYPDTMVEFGDRLLFTTYAGLFRCTIPEDPLPGFPPYRLARFLGATIDPWLDDDIKMTALVVDPEEEALWGFYSSYNSNRVVRIEMEPEVTLSYVHPDVNWRDPVTGRDQIIAGATFAPPLPPPVSEQLRWRNIDRDYCEAQGFYVVPGDDPGIRIQGVSFINIQDYHNMEAEVPWSPRRANFFDPINWEEGSLPGENDWIEWRAHYVAPYLGDVMVYDNPLPDTNTPWYTFMQLYNLSSFPQLYGGLTVFEHVGGLLRVRDLRLDWEIHGGEGDYESTYEQYGYFFDRPFVYRLLGGEDTPALEVDQLVLGGDGVREYGIFEMGGGTVDAQTLEIEDGVFDQQAGTATITYLNPHGGTYALHGGDLHVRNINIGDAQHEIQGRLSVSGGNLYIPLLAGEYWRGLYLHNGDIILSGDIAVNANLANVRDTAHWIIGTGTGRVEEPRAVVQDGSSGVIRVNNLVIGAHGIPSRYIKEGSGTLHAERIELGDSDDLDIGVFSHHAGRVMTGMPGVPTGGHTGWPPMRIQEHGQYRLLGGSVLIPWLRINPGGRWVMTDGEVVTYGQDTNVLDGAIRNVGTYRQDGGMVTTYKLGNDGLLDMTGGRLYAALCENAGELRLVGGELELSGDYVQEGSDEAITHIDGTLRAAHTFINSGTLRGRGNIYGHVYLGTNAAFEPGGSIGTMTIDGDYTQSDAATLTIELGGGEHDRVNVTGAATLGGTLEVIPTDPSAVDDAFTTPVLIAHSVSGQFARITVRGWSPRVAYAAAEATGIVSLTASTHKPSTFAEWQAIAFTPEELLDTERTGPMGNGEGDLWNNLMEYAMDLSPGEQDRPAMKLEVLHPVIPDPAAVTFTFPWAKYTTDVAYDVLVSTNLVDWNAATYSVANRGDWGTAEAIALELDLPRPTPDVLFVQLLILERGTQGSPPDG